MQSRLLRFKPCRHAQKVSFCPFCLLRPFESANDQPNKRKFSRTYAVVAGVLFKSAEPMQMWQGFCSSQPNLCSCCKGSEKFATLCSCGKDPIRAYLVWCCCVVERFKGQWRSETDTVTFYFMQGQERSSQHSDGKMPSTLQSSWEQIEIGWGWASAWQRRRKRTLSPSPPLQPPTGRCLTRGAARRSAQGSMRLCASGPDRLWWPTKLLS